MPNSKINQITFFGLGIAPRLLDIITRLNFVAPTPIQEKAIPVALEGKDIIGIAQTGTGKTLAFGIPMIQKIAQAKNQGLVILPTRELAHQVEETLHQLGRSLGLRTALLIGGASMKMQMQAIRRSPHIIIGTPGRINDHLEQRTLSLHDVSILVLDEADRMLDMGFLPQIRKILAKLSKNRQTMLFSATMPDSIVKIATEHMRLPFRVEIARPGTAAEKVAQELFVLKNEQKIPLLEKLLLEYRGSILIFSRTKHGARKICHSLKRMGHTAAEIHSARSLAQRREALEGFKSGKYRILVATDIASRGIDVTGIELVINYDIPENPEDYLHRIGRTGRAGAEGRAISFVMPDQKREVRDIERLLQTYIIASKLPELPSSSPRQNYPDDVGARKPAPRGNQRKKYFHHPKRRF
ncbi:DEAD/DEAH box helicase [Candidatus Giovannonibacteria bacterium]|nr:DEAD/DEAH box helicase [Candidatus Giovannonibacteria bacterium]